jgi:hypothetical protein
MQPAGIVLADRGFCGWASSHCCSAKMSTSSMIAVPEFRTQHIVLVTTLLDDA